MRRAATGSGDVLRELGRPARRADAGAGPLLRPAVRADRQHAGLLAGRRRVGWRAIGFISGWASPTRSSSSGARSSTASRRRCIGRLGRRRSWMIISQLVVAAGLIGMALIDPSSASAGSCWRWRHRDRRGDPGHGHRRLADRDRRGRQRARPAHLVLLARLPRGPDPHRGGDPVGRQADRLAALLRHLWRGHGHRRRRGAADPREPARADAVMEEKAQAAARHPLTAVYDAVFGPLIAFFRAHGLGHGGADAGDDQPLSPVRLHARADDRPLLQALNIDNDTIALRAAVRRHARLVRRHRARRFLLACGLGDRRR